MTLGDRVWAGRRATRAAGARGRRHPAGEGDRPDRPEPDGRHAAILRVRGRGLLPDSPLTVTTMSSRSTHRTRPSPSSARATTGSTCARTATRVWRCSGGGPSSPRAAARCHSAPAAPFSSKARNGRTTTWWRFQLRMAGTSGSPAATPDTTTSARVPVRVLRHRGGRGPRPQWNLAAVPRVRMVVDPDRGRRRLAALSRRPLDLAGPVGLDVGPRPRNGGAGRPPTTGAGSRGTPAGTRVPVAPRATVVTYSPALVAFVGGGAGFSVSAGVGGPDFVGGFRSLRANRCIRGGAATTSAVPVANVNVTNVTYVNRTYMTPVNQQTFVSSGVVNTDYVRDPAIVTRVERAPVVRGAVPIVPTSASLRVAARQAPAVRPPAAVAERAVVTRSAPAAGPAALRAESGRDPREPGAARDGGRGREHLDAGRRTGTAGSRRAPGGRGNRTRHVRAEDRRQQCAEARAGGGEPRPAAGDEAGAAGGRSASGLERLPGAGSPTGSATGSATGLRRSLRGRVGRMQK